MASGTLSFIVPVRHHHSVADWPSVKALMAMTLRSIAGQTAGNWNGAVVANEGADLPALPAGFRAVRVDFPHHPLPDRRVDHAASTEAFRAEKGRRVLAGLLALRPRGHIMIVDYDDLVSCRLAALVAEQPDAHGWFFETGFLYSGQRLLYRHPREFFRFCGTSHIIRADLLEVPASREAASEDYIRYRLGSHIFNKALLDAQGTPLAPLPFDGTIYRIGHPFANSGSSPLFRHVFPLAGFARPHKALGRVTRFRPLTPRLRQEFFGT
jgi:hypothetical protein